MLVKNGPCWVRLLVAAAAVLATSTVARGEHLGADDKNCSNFRTWPEANAFFLSAGPGDPHHLDSNRDGVPCESLPGAPGNTANAPTNTPRPTATRRATATPVPTATPTTVPTETPTRTRLPTRSASTATPMGLAILAPTLTSRSPAAGPGSPAERATSPDLSLMDPAVSSDLDPPIPRMPDPAPAAGDGARDLPPPAERWLLILSATEVRGEMGDLLRVVESGQWVAVVETRDGWARIALGEDRTLVRWIRLDDRVLVVVPERGPQAP